MATIISCWEVLIVAMAVTAHVAVRVLHALHPVANRGTQASTPAVAASPLHTVALVVTYVLALAGAMALWEMRRLAFELLAARFVVEVALFVLDLLRPVTAAAARHADLRLAFIAIDVVALAVNAAIAWYAWQVTRRQPLVLATQPGSPEAAAEKELTTSQFYLAPDHKKTIHKP